MSARKGMNLKQVKYQLKSLEEAFERDATAIRSGIGENNEKAIYIKEHQCINCPDFICVEKIFDKWYW